MKTAVTRLVARQSPSHAKNLREALERDFAERFDRAFSLLKHAAAAFRAAHPKKILCEKSCYSAGMLLGSACGIARLVTEWELFEMLPMQRPTHAETCLMYSALSYGLAVRQKAHPRFLASVARVVALAALEV
jgi:hypothetical protein